MLISPAVVNPALSAEELDHYRAEGYLIRPGALSPTAVAQLQQAAQDIESHCAALSRSGHTYFLDGHRFVDHAGTTIQFEHHPGAQTLRVVEPVHHHHPTLNQLIDQDIIATPMRQILGTDALSLWTSKLNFKPASEGSGFGWHQDSPYWIHDHSDVDHLPNVMITFDPQDRENGCFRMIAGSHRQGLLPGTNDGSQLGGFFTDPNAFDLANAVYCDVPAGSLIFFDPHIVHGSAVNQTPQHRRALILTFQLGHRRLLKLDQTRRIKASDPEIGTNSSTVPG